MEKKKRGGKDAEIITREKLIEMIRQLPNERDRALVAVLYLTGARISELLGVKNAEGGWHYAPLRREQIEKAKFNDKEIMVFYNISTFKRRKNFVLRNIPVNVEREQELVQIVWDYIKNMSLETPVFVIGRKMAWRTIKDNTGLFCHYFRHLRNTHLTTYYGFTIADLMLFNGWMRTDTAGAYTHLNWQDLVKKMIGGN